MTKAFDEYFDEAWSGSDDRERRTGRTISVYAWNAAIHEAIKVIAQCAGDTPLTFEKVGELMVKS